jgi:hypothetical protein
MTCTGPIFKVSQAIQGNAMEAGLSLHQALP